MDPKVLILIDGWSLRDTTVLQCESLEEILLYCTTVEVAHDYSTGADLLQVRIHRCSPVSLYLGDMKWVGHRYEPLPQGGSMLIDYTIICLPCFITPPTICQFCFIGFNSANRQVNKISCMKSCWRPVFCSWWKLDISGIALCRDLFGRGVVFTQKPININSGINSFNLILMKMWIMWDCFCMRYF